MKFVEVEVDRKLSNGTGYEILMSKKYTVETFFEKLSTDPIFKNAEGPVRFVEGENANGQLFFAPSNKLGAWYSPKKKLYSVAASLERKKVLKAEVITHNLDSKKPSATYYLLLNEQPENMTFETVEIRDHDGTDTSHYDVKVEKNFTVEEFMDAVITDPINYYARGGFKILEIEKQTEDRLFDCEGEDFWAVYRTGRLNDNFPMPKQYLKREIQKIEAYGYGFDKFIPAITYLLLLKKETCYYETEKGQFSLFPVKISKKRKEK